MKPTAEDWIILRCINAWSGDVGGTHRNKTAVKTVAWLIDKFGEDTVVWMLVQILREEEHG